MQARRIQLTRLIGSCLVLLAVVFFSHQFSSMQLDAFVHGLGYSLAELPRACVWLAWYSAWAMLLPPMIAVVGIRRITREKQPSTAVELLSQATLLLALLLALGCLLAWQLPYVVSVSEAL
jgi:hypothetical protein